MIATRVIGIDPGPIPGIVRLHIQDGKLVERWTHVVQCSAPVAPEILGAFLENGTSEWPHTLVAIERFVVGRGSMRSGQAGAVTRDLVGLLTAVANDNYVAVVLRSAAEVKPWATDTRLAPAGLLEATKGMRHARDAARHALFAACKDGDLPDPLSKRSNR